SAAALGSGPAFCHKARAATRPDQGIAATTARAPTGEARGYRRRSTMRGRKRRPAEPQIQVLRDARREALDGPVPDHIELAVDHQRGETVDHRPRGHRQLLDVPGADESGALALRDRLDEQSERGGGSGLVQSRMRSAVRDLAPEHYADLRRMTARERDVGLA